MGGTARRRVGPNLLPHFVPTVTGETGFGVQGVAIRQNQLLCRVTLRRFIRAESGRILQIKGNGHVLAIQPHLAGINLLMPEPAVAGAGLGVQLGAQQRGGLFVFFLSGLLIQEHELPPVVQVIQVACFPAVPGDAPVRGHHAVERVMNIIEVCTVSRQRVQHFHAAPDHTVIIAPFFVQQPMAGHHAVGDDLGGMGEILRQHTT